MTIQTGRQKIVSDFSYFEIASNNNNKNWNETGFLATAKQLVGRLAGVLVFLTGDGDKGEGESESGRERR